MCSSTMVSCFALIWEIMKRNYSVIAALALGALSASANAVLIDFNSLAEGTLVSNQFAGVTFAAGDGGLAVPNAGGNGFATNTGLGVTDASTGDIGGLGTPNLMSGMLLHRFGDDWLNEDGDPVFVMTFAGNISDISIDFNGIAIPASTGIFAFAGGTLVASDVATTLTGGDTLTLSGLTGVTQIAVTPGDFNDWVGVDNINYTAANPVPEPATMAVLGLGAAALLRRRNKRS
jgi:PEP-CTERM motif